MNCFAPEFSATEFPRIGACVGVVSLCVRRVLSPFARVYTELSALQRRRNA